MKIIILFGPPYHLSDAYIWYGSHKHAQLAAANGDNVYQYQFNFKGPYG